MGLKFLWSASSSFLLTGYFQWFILLSVHPAVAGGPFDQCDQHRKRNLGAPNLRRRSQRLLEQVRHRTARLPCTKRSNLRQSALASSPSVFTRLLRSSSFCGQTT